MSDEIKNENDRASEPSFAKGPDSIPTAVFVKAMEEMRGLHQKQSEERHKANSAQQKTVGMISLEQLKLSDRMQVLADTQVDQGTRMAGLEAKLDVVISLTKSNGADAVAAAVAAGNKSNVAAKTAVKTLLEQRLAIGGAIVTLGWYAIEYFMKH